MAKVITDEQLESTVVRVAECIAEVAETASGAITEMGNELSCVMTGASANAAGTSGMVPAPGAGKQGAFLRGDGTWAQPSMSGSAFVVSNTAPNSEMIWFKVR